MEIDGVKGAAWVRVLSGQSAWRLVLEGKASHSLWVLSCLNRLTQGSKTGTNTGYSKLE